jgi:hypothetical protein
MMFDFLKPILYRAEKFVASKSIPSVVGFPNRLLLADHPVLSMQSSSSSFDHSLWDKVLKKHVHVGATFGVVTGVNAVDYKGISQDPNYVQYMQALETAEPDKLLPREQLAFWMNVYNAACIHLIVEYERKNQGDVGGVGLESINKITDDKGPVWDKDAAVIGGVAVSLNHIEHEQLRQKWAEPAVHGCINCASASCPNLRPEAYRAADLRAQMDEQMREWLANDTKGLCLSDARCLELSRIFLWFEDDFGGWEGLREYLSAYIDDEQVAEKIRENQVRVRHFEYSWQMNRAVVEPSK